MPKPVQGKKGLERWACEASCSCAVRGYLDFARVLTALLGTPTRHHTCASEGLSPSEGSLCSAAAAMLCIVPNCNVMAVCCPFVLKRAVTFQ